MKHVPVLLDEVVAALELAPDVNVIDCTLGDGGHAEQILTATAPHGRLLGIDADPESMLRAKKFLHSFGERAIFERQNFEHLGAILKETNFGPVHRILMDLGWSSPQFEERGRGFSFMNPDEPLDMRYDTRLACPHSGELPTDYQGTPLFGRCTAAEVLFTKSKDELADILYRYGDESLHDEIASAIVNKRKEYALETVDDLVQIILAVYRKKLHSTKDIPWVGGIHPATKVFQALRIAVNDEFGVIERTLPQAIEALEQNGILAVITFHSGEDRIVKHYFKSQDNKTITILTKKPIIATDKECKENPRARSAKLRVVRKK